MQQRLLINETLKKLKAGLELGRKLKKEGKLSKEKEEILKKIENQFQAYLNEMEKTEEKINKLKEEMAVFKKKIIKVLERVYPGVSVGITDVVYVVPEEKSGPLTFYLDKDVIQIDVTKRS